MGIDGIKIVAGMTPEDVMNSSEATNEQKALAKFFDSDGVYGYSEEEASIFNSTTITKKGKHGFYLERSEDVFFKDILLKGQKEDGTFSKETYSTYYQNNFLESKLTRVWDENSRSWVNTEECTCFPNGFLKSLTRKKPYPTGKEVHTVYHNNYNPKTISVKKWNGKEWIETLHKEFNWKGNLTKKIIIKEEK